MSAYIAKFTTDIRSVKGSENTVADALSRPAVDPVSQSHTVDFTALATAQETDAELATYMSTPDSSLQLQRLPVAGSPSLLICDVSTGVARPFVPQKFRHDIFLSIHSLSHPGGRATRRLVSARFVWHLCRRILPLGPRPATRASELKSSVIPTLLLVAFLCRISVSIPSTSISLVLSLHAMAVVIS